MNLLSAARQKATEAYNKDMEGWIGQSIHQIDLAVQTDWPQAEQQIKALLHRGHTFGRTVSQI